MRLTVSTFFWEIHPDITSGQIHPQSGYRYEDLEHLTFPDNSFDLFVPKDVMENIFDPKKVFKEIAQVLKPGEVHYYCITN